jgi:N-carbamoyl-L-amino-acid hydrolase
VPGGGLYDGAFGVAAGIEAARRLKEEGRALRHSLEIWGFNGEESNPFGGTFGSRAVCGLVDPAQPGLAEALAGVGLTTDDVLACAKDFSGVKCYLEAHIEQGDRLYRDGLDIGAVSGIVSVIRYRVTAIGQANHAGTTAMKDRSDALVAMSKLIVEAEKSCRGIDDALVFTVGTLSLEPGSENVIPGRVSCCFEFRHTDRRVTDLFLERIREIASGIKTVSFDISPMVDKGSVKCDPRLISVIDRAAEDLGYSHAVVPSGAGHDANPMAHRVPIGMIFVPSEGGFSHCGEEYTKPEDLRKGADVLYRALLTLDEEE